MAKDLPERTGLQQRVLPAYRKPFFDALAEALPGGLGVFAGAPDPEEGILQADELRLARWTRARNHRIGAGKVFLLWQSGWREWLEKEDPNALVIEANPRYLSNNFLLRAMRRRGRPVIGWSLGPLRSAGWLIRSYYRSFAALVVYSRSGAEAYQKLGIPAESVFIAPNAVESTTAERLLQKPNARAVARAELNLGDQPTILFVGRLQERKRVDLLIRACAQAGGECNLLIVGDGADRPRLEKLAGEMSTSARFLGDLRGEALGNCFLAADLFVLPGTGGLALQEALLYGKPVAAAEADGSQVDLIHPGENGWLLPPGDAEALVAVLREALQNQEHLRAMGEASRRIVSQTATMEKMVEGFLQALRFCIE